MTRPPSFGQLGLFTGVPQSENFGNFKNLLPNKEMPASTVPQPWSRGPAFELPETFVSSDESVGTAQFLAESETSALLVLQDGAVRYEEYWLTGGRDVQWISMSVAKSIISALVGIAVSEGSIRSVDDPITNYIDVAPGSAFDGVRIRDVLQMSSGARWNEAYDDPSSEVFRLMAALAPPGGSLNHFVENMAPEYRPGTVCRYNSGDTQVLGSLLRAATGRSVADYMHEKLVEPLGFMRPGYWLVDPEGTELSFAGVNLVPGDFARIGELYRLGGTWHGTQLVPQEWVRASTTVDSPVREAGQVLLGGNPVGIGYGYQWWIPSGERAAFTAIGVYNQYVYVDPLSRSTIVKLSATRRFSDPQEPTSGQHFDFFQAMAEALG